jgi:3-methyladenine DNA glycosylase Tag
LFGRARWIAVDRNGPDVAVDERLPFGAMAGADQPMAKRRPPKLTSGDGRFVASDQDFIAPLSCSTDLHLAGRLVQADPLCGDVDPETIGRRGRRSGAMKLRKFSGVLALAEKLHGAAGVKTRLAERMSDNTAGLDQSDGRFLAAMTRAVFSSGFSWEVVEQKWPGFEEAFEGFDPHRVAFYADKEVARLLKDTRIIRNGAKIQATIANARFVTDTAKAHGSVSASLKGWPPTDQIGLMEHLKKKAARLGGSTAMYFLRFNGWDAFILSADVIKALIREGVIGKPPTSKADLRAVQDAFNGWTKESGRSQSEVSRILALSAGPS